jgi:hypothetical protein
MRPGFARGASESEALSGLHDHTSRNFKLNRAYSCRGPLAGGGQGHWHCHGDRDCYTQHSHGGNLNLRPGLRAESCQSRSPSARCQDHDSSLPGTRLRLVTASRPGPRRAGLGPRSGGPLPDFSSSWLCQWPPTVRVRVRRRAPANT